MVKLKLPKINFSIFSENWFTDKWSKTTVGISATLLFLFNIIFLPIILFLVQIVSNFNEIQ